MDGRDLGGLRGSAQRALGHFHRKSTFQAFDSPVFHPAFRGLILFEGFVFRK
jgi:hypothetical protein